MVSVLSLWLPILLSAVAVFIISSIIHMVLPYHRTDFAGLPNQDKVRDALRPFSIPPGDYMIPHSESGNPGDPEFVKKAEEGPVAIMTVMETGTPSMGSSLAQWFVYCIVVSIFAGYIGGAALGPGARYLDVFQFVGTTAFAGYALALAQGSIWYKRKWSSTIKSSFDGLIYAAFTAGLFGWLWP